MMPENEQAMAPIPYFLSAIDYRIPLYRTWLSRQLKKERPDLIHAHFGPVACHYLPLARQLRIPLLASFYGYDFLKVPFQKPAYQQRYRQLFEQADAISTTGTRTPVWLTEQGCPIEKIHPIALGLSPEKFSYIQREKAPNRLRLLQVATFSAKKGHLDTLEAFRLALEKCPDMELTLAGEIQDKALYHKILDFIQTHGLKSKVVIRDFVPHDTLPQLLGSFDVFIHPSHLSEGKDTEGSPLAITEALSTGMPVIATLHADIPTQVQHEENGFLAQERDVGQLARFIQQFYQMNRTTYNQMSMAAHRHALEHFDVRQSGKQLYRLYEVLIKNRSDQRVGQYN